MARLHLTRPEPDEDELHASVAKALDVLLLTPAQWTTFPAGGYGLTAAAAARLYRLGLRPGWPDVLISYRGFFGIELKTRTGTLTRTRIKRTRSGGARIIVGQAEMHERLRKSGAQIAICRSLDAVLAQLTAWDIPTRVRRKHERGSSLAATNGDIAL